MESTGTAQAQEHTEYLQYSSGAATAAPWELEVRSPKLKQWAWILVVLIMAIHIFMAIVVGVGYSGANVTTIDQWAFVGIGIIFSGVALLGLRPRVRVNADGVEVRNFFGTGFYPWDVIHGMSFPQGSRCARLELPDFEFVAMWAIQAADSATVVDTVNRFRLLEDKYLPED